MKKTLFCAAYVLAVFAVTEWAQALSASAAQPESSAFVSEPMAINKVLMIEKLANDYQTQFEHSRQKSSDEDELRRSLETKGRDRIDAILEEVKEPQELYTMAVLLNEGYGELFESIHDRLLFFASEAVVLRLAALGTDEAYHYFIRLKQVYGTDGAGSLQYRFLEFRYFKQYSEDPRVLQAESEYEFI